MSSRRHAGAEDALLELYGATAANAEVLQAHGYTRHSLSADVAFAFLGTVLTGALGGVVANAIYNGTSAYEARRYWEDRAESPANRDGVSPEDTALELIDVLSLLPPLVVQESVRASCIAQLQARGVAPEIAKRVAEALASAASAIPEVVDGQNEGNG